MLANFMYILPMILGRTFDVRYDRVGVDIFPQSELDRNKTLQEHRMSSIYKVVDSTDTYKDVLQITGDMSLKSKAGKVNFQGTGAYLKDSSKSSRTVEILTRVHYETITVSLPSDAKPSPDWTQFRSEDIGTHYVESVTYGGELVASLKFRANKESDFNSINGIVKGSFSGGSIDSIVVEGKLEKVKSSLQDKATMEISFYANVPLKGVPQTIEGLKSLVNEFKSHVAEVNNGMGVPIRVQLAETSHLGGRVQFLRNRELDAELSDFEMRFDDIRGSDATLREWARTLPVSINADLMKKISDFRKRLFSVNREFHAVIGNMNVEKGGEQLLPAKTAYDENKPSLPGKFSRELKRLMTVNVPHDKIAYATGTSTYIRWGKKSCPVTSPMTSLLHVGYTAISSLVGTGGGLEYLCLTTDPEIGQPSSSSDSTISAISGVKYGYLGENAFKVEDQSFFGNGVPCAACHVTNRTLIRVFPAIDECQPGWITEYSGVLVSGANIHGSHMCLDEEPEYNIHQAFEENSHIISAVHVNKEFPLPQYEAGKAISCIVCSR